MAPGPPSAGPSCPRGAGCSKEPPEGRGWDGPCRTSCPACVALDSAEAAAAPCLSSAGAAPR
eukprot:9789884-Alexandrium_andersonii.AAC.1